MRQRIKKSTMIVEFCYSTVVARVNNSSSNEIRAELTRLNIRAAYRETTTVKTAVAVEFNMFGSPVQKPLDWIERLEAAHMEYKVIYKGYFGASSKSWSGYHWDFSVSLYGSVRQFVALGSSKQGSKEIRKQLMICGYEVLR